MSDIKTRARVWITKYALSTGIQEIADAGIDDEGNAWVPVDGMKYRQFIRVSDVHHTAEAALKRAEVMRKAKIASLRRQADRLDSLEIKVAKEP